ncbi:MAG: hypothetical protein ACYDAQ_01190 [Mycobacteriales bacterium]
MITLRPARTVPLEADQQARAIAAIAELLAGYLLNHPPATNPGTDAAGHREPTPGCP